jgi:roadblock/LC7 domain-containing protein
VINRLRCIGPLVLFVLLASVTLPAQQPEYKSSIGISYTSLRFLPENQYLGAGIDYRYMVRPWVGVEVQASKFPQSQYITDAMVGRPVEQFDASVLIGHRWSRVGLFGEGGFGVLRPQVFSGFNNQGVEEFDTRYFPDLLLGGLLDVPVGRRWSLTYEVRDNLAFIGHYTQTIGQIPYTTTAGQCNMPEGRIGVAFHFEETKDANRMKLPNAPIGSKPAAQEKELKNFIGVSYTTLRFVPNAQYIGAGLEYGYMFRSWAGVQVEVSDFPQSQSYVTAVSGGAIVQANASALLGHRWGRVGLYGEGGIGALRAHAFNGFTQQGEDLYDLRNYPDVLMGGLLDVSLGRRWSVRFNVRDNLTIVGAHTYNTAMGPTSFPAQQINAAEGRAGVAFHF